MIGNITGQTKSIICRSRKERNYKEKERTEAEKIDKRRHHTEHFAAKDLNVPKIMERNEKKATGAR